MASAGSVCFGGGTDVVRGFERKCSKGKARQNQGDSGHGWGVVIGCAAGGSSFRAEGGRSLPKHTQLRRLILNRGEIRKRLTVWLSI